MLNDPYQVRPVGPGVCCVFDGSDIVEWVAGTMPEMPFTISRTYKDAWEALPNEAKEAIRKKVGPERSAVLDGPPVD